MSTNQGSSPRVSVGDDVGVVGERVAGRGQRLQLGVAEHDDLTVGQRVVREVHAGALGQVRGRARALDELGQPGDVVGLQVRLEHRDDRHALALGELDVRVDEVDMRIDDRERLLGLAAQQVRRAGGVVVEQLAEVHGLTSYQAIY